MDALPAAVDQLAACSAPALIGVRHHSAALARAMPALLDRLRPTRLLIELPSDLDAWLPWLADPATTAPVALSAVAPDGDGLCFLPFADFSPELAALRWAQAHGVPAHGIDLPTDRRRAIAGREAGGGGMHERLHRRAGVDDAVTWWDRLVEVPACDRDPEELRRAALAVGRAWRDDAPAGERDLVREAWMRRRIAELGADGAVAVIGSFHAAALVGTHPVCAIPEAGEPSRTALIPYTFAQFDERSGYGAGIRDPAWQQTAWAAADAAALDGALAAAAVAVCRRLRGQRHQASTADARELVRVARDLARLRGLPTAGRGELVEAAQSVLARGELLGAGRAVAAALEHELVGERRGRLPPQCPRSGLEPAVERLLADLKLPGPEQLGEEPRELRLDPLRSDLDRLRAVLLARLDQLGIAYGKRDDADGVEHLGQVWTLQWTAASAATLAAAAVHGAEPAQAAAGELAGRIRRAGDDPEQLVALAGLAARSGLGLALDGLLARLVAAPFLDSARLPGLVAAMALLTRLQRGHEPGLPSAPVVRPGMALAAWHLPAGVDAAPLVLAAERCLDGLAGSDRVEDVIALLDLWAWWASAGDEAPGDGRLRWALKRMHDSGGALMQGAAAGLLVRLGDLQPAALGGDLGGWIDAALDSEGRARLRARFAGLLLTADSLLAAAPEALDQAHARLVAAPDDAFLARLPALRAGALAIAPAARQRLLEALLERHAAGERAGSLADDPLRLVAWGAADAAAAAAVGRLLGDPGPRASAREVVPSAPPRTEAHGPGSISAADRWRLVLGEPRAAPAQVMRAARALEACYGRGSGEGAARGQGQGGGDGTPEPDVRAWDDEVAALFGGDVREEVIADRALATPAALELLDPARAVPSVALLERVLSLHGGLPAGAAPQLRRLAKRLVDALAAALARKLRPSLSGLGVARSTRRRSPRLDLRATLRANLDQARSGPDGPQLVLRRLRFLARARRQMDWHLVLVVDVSSSMEASMVHSALMASVFAGLPALSVGFVAVSTEVVDLSGRVDDPLGLLLEVRVGGGTRLGLGLHRARELLRVPSRSMVVLISDFEEGVSVGELLGEVRALRDAGARLLGMAALDAHGQPRYHAGIAAQVASAGMPVAALSPQHVARWVAEQLR